jgi:hypothetical protein
MDRMPHRVRVEGDLFHGRIPAAAVYVGRAAPGLPASPYANPFKATTYGAAGPAEMFREYIAARPWLLEAAQLELAGCDLACWCPLPAPGQPDTCHAAVLIELVNT